MKAVGRDPTLIAATLAQVRKQTEEALDALISERRGLERDVSRSNAEIRELAADAATLRDDGPQTARLAELQERIRLAERRLTETREETLRLRAELIDEGEVAEALAAFDPVWEALSPREQARVLQLLIERVDYDGSDGTVSVAFHAAGLSTFAEEFRIEEDAA